jgi:hypothetical protein
MSLLHVITKACRYTKEYNRMYVALLPPSLPPTKKRDKDKHFLLGRPISYRQKYSFSVELLVIKENAVQIMEVLITLAL